MPSDGADAGEAVDHDGDQGPVAQADEACAVVDRVDRRSWRASSAESTGVLPFLTTCLGPLTEAAGLTGTTWPVTSQSKSMRMAARCCLTEGARAGLRQSLDVGGDGDRLDGGRARPCRSHQRRNWPTARA